MATATALKAAKKDSDGLTGIDNQRLLDQIAFPEICFIVGPDGNPILDKQGNQESVRGACVSAIMHTLARHINNEKKITWIGYETTLLAAGLSPTSDGTMTKAIAWLSNTYGILKYEQRSGTNNNYWFKVKAERQLIERQGIFDSDCKRLLFGKDLTNRLKELAADPYFGANHQSGTGTSEAVTTSRGQKQPGPVGDNQRPVGTPNHQSGTPNHQSGTGLTDIEQEYEQERINSKENPPADASTSADFDLDSPSTQGLPETTSPSPLRSPLPHVSAQLCASLSPSRMRTVCADGDRPIVAMEDRDGSDRPSSLPPKLSVLISAVCMEHGGLKKITKRDADVLHLECGCQRATNPDIDKRLARADAIYGVAV